MGITAAVTKELRETLARPGRIGNAFRPSRVRHLAFRLAGGEPEMVDGRREYSSYEHYVRHQKSKLPLLDLSTYDVTFRKALVERLGPLPIDWRTSSVLCLAARIGTEVRAFHDLGAFGVGIDLNPGDDNRLVLPGDFHDLQFADGTVDVVYTNSLDHALELDKVIAEVKRVLRPGGMALIEALLGTTEGTGDFGRWEARSWERVEEISGAFVEGGFSLEGSIDFDHPWNGRLFLLRA